MNFKKIGAKIRNFFKPTNKVGFGYDAAQTTDANREHWRGADSLTPDQMNNPLTRAILRSRARYEFNNNPWLFGLVKQIAEDIVGTGARLQIENEDVSFATTIVNDFTDWAAEVKLTKMLLNVKKAVARDGESFVLLTTRQRNKSKVKLFPLIFSCDRVSSPIGQNSPEDNNIDGVIIDDCQVPIKYQISKQNPNVAAISKWETVSADYIIHYFDQEYPEQHRGVPEYTPCLNDIALLRRYTKATLDKMENASNISGVFEPTEALESQIENTDDFAQKPFKKFVLPSRSFVFSPLGYRLKQYELGNPNDSQQSFALNVKIDCARCVLATRNVVTGDSSNYNYASGRLDFQSYFRAIQNIRADMEKEILNRIFIMWYAEYSAGMERRETPAFSWYWDGFAHVDPMKESKSEQLDMENGTRTLIDVCAEHGLNWKKQVDNRLTVEKYEREQREKLGLPQRNTAAENQQTDNGASDNGEN